MAKEESSCLCAFDVLFEKSVPHIFEKIFFSLDYDSFMECKEVSKAWGELLSTEPYRQMSEELLMRKKENEKKLCEAAENGNAEEVIQLLSRGVDKNCRVPEWPWTVITPLSIAIRCRHKEVVRILLQYGADPYMGLRNTYMVRNGLSCPPRHY